MVTGFVVHRLQTSVSWEPPIPSCSGRSKPHVFTVFRVLARTENTNGSSTYACMHPLGAAHMPAVRLMGAAPSPDHHHRQIWCHEHHDHDCHQPDHHHRHHHYRHHHHRHHHHHHHRNLATATHGCLAETENDAQGPLKKHQK